MIRLKRARVQVGPPAGANPCAPCHVCSLISGAHYSPYLVRQLSEFVSVAVAVAVAILSWRAFPFQLAGKSSPNLITLHMKYFWGFSTGCHGERERSWVRQGRENPADLHLADREGGKAGRRRGWLLGRHSLGINGSCLWQSSSICSRSFGDISAAAALPVDCQFPRAPPACCLLRAPAACCCHCYSDHHSLLCIRLNQTLHAPAYIELNSVAHFTILNKRWVTNKKRNLCKKIDLKCDYFKKILL